MNATTTLNTSFADSWLGSWVGLVFSSAAAMSGAEERNRLVEAALVTRATRGDGRAFAELVGPHLPMLLRIASRAAGSSALAEDAVQEALALAHSRLHSYTPGTNLRAFLAAIAARQAHTLLRAERRRRAREELASAAPEPTAASPAEELAAEQLAARVREVLADLPEKKREALLLRLDANLSYAEIAAAIGSTEGSVRVLVHQALAELKTRLASLTEAP